MNFNFPKGLKRPVDFALFLVNSAAMKAGCKAFLAPAMDTLKKLEAPGFYTNIQTRLVVTGLGERAVEVLFLVDNAGYILEQLKAQKVEHSVDAKECLEARSWLATAVSEAPVAPAERPIVPLKKVAKPRKPRKKKSEKVE